MNKIKISAVAYTNTKPFIYGIERANILSQIELSLDVPSDCAQKLIENKVDIGLVPVAVVPSIPNASIISDYCIGSVGAVNSVFIFSNVPVAHIKSVKLDPQSRTSNQLAQVLLKFHFKVNVSFTDNQDAQTDAALDDFDLEDYLMNKLDFELTAEKRKALDLFLSYISQL
ncbi:MAG: hypothetical protein EOO07_05710 [Chitinophagaceae bacterium]|nr:MAG: hypothetical protein EOO07_05710 [Chitinophagaceae bacterium]